MPPELGGGSGSRGRSLGTGRADIKCAPERWQLGGGGLVGWAWLVGRRLYSFREERWEGQKYRGAKGGYLGAAHFKSGDAGRKDTDRGNSWAWDFQDMRHLGRGSVRTGPFGSHAQEWEWLWGRVRKPLLSWPLPPDSPSLSCPPHPHHPTEAEG